MRFERVTRIMNNALTVDGANKGLASRPPPPNPKLYDFYVEDRPTYPAPQVGVTPEPGPTTYAYFVWNGRAWAELDATQEQVVIFDE